MKKYTPRLLHVFGEKVLCLKGYLRLSLMTSFLSRTTIVASRNSDSGCHFLTKSLCLNA